MSRELKRVPLDFNWPLRETWKGYVNDLDDGGTACTACKGDGMTPEARFLHTTFYRHNVNDTGFFGAFIGSNIVAVPGPADLKEKGWRPNVIQNIEWARKAGFKTLTHWSDKLDEEDIRLLIKAGRLDDVHVQKNGKWVKATPKQMTPDVVNQYVSMTLGGIGGLEWTGTKRRLRKMGAKYACAPCKGKGTIYHDLEKKKAYDRWKRSEPPKGPGFQLWQTISEGSPVSPVFESALELATWLEDNDTLQGKRVSAQVWLKMIMTDSVDTGSMLVGKVKNGKMEYFGSKAEMPE